MNKIIKELIDKAYELYSSETLTERGLNLIVEDYKFDEAEERKYLIISHNMISGGYYTGFYTFLISMKIIGSSPRSINYNGEQCGCYEIPNETVDKINETLQSKLSVYEMVTGDIYSYILFSITGTEIDGDDSLLSQLGTVNETRSFIISNTTLLPKTIASIIEKVSEKVLVSVVGEKVIVTKIPKE